MITVSLNLVMEALQYHKHSMILHLLRPFTFENAFRSGLTCLFTKYLVSICCVLGFVLLLVVAAVNKECKKASPWGAYIPAGVNHGD